MSDLKKMVPVWNCTVTSPVFIGVAGLPAVNMTAPGLHATLQVLALGPGDMLVGLFDERGEPHDCWFMHHEDSLGNVAHLMCKVLAGFSEPSMCPPAAAVAEATPAWDWKTAAAEALRGMLDPETGLPRQDCVSRIELVRVDVAPV